MTLYCDMDGVLADFNRHYLDRFGIVTNTSIDNVDWKMVRAARPNFFRGIPPMEDMHVLWEAIKDLGPTILTGIPDSVDAAHNDKRDWIAERLGPDVPVICCASRDKRLYCKPGDIIIDDWEKHRSKWLAAGGVWVLHTSAVDTIWLLIELGVLSRDRAPDLPCKDCADANVFTCCAGDNKRETT